MSIKRAVWFGRASALVGAVSAALWACGGAAPEPETPASSSEPVASEVVSAPPPAPPPGEAPPDGSSELEKLLRKTSDKSVCDSFDYGVGGGLRNAWCHRPEGVNVASIQSLAGVPIFVAGPHTETGLALNETSSFGHYNPAFVQWLSAHAISERGSLAQLLTQPAYDAHAKKLARVLWLTQAKLHDDESCLKREVTAYKKAISAKKAGYYERFFYVMNPAFCDKPARKEAWYMNNGFDAGVDGNVAKTAAAFWLRREMDGTAAEFTRALRGLLSAYDPAVLDEVIAGKYARARLEMGMR